MEEAGNQVAAVGFTRQGPDGALKGCWNSFAGGEVSGSVAATVGKLGSENVSIQAGNRHFVSNGSEFDS